MSNWARTLALALLVGVGGFAIAYVLAGNPEAQRAARQGNAMQWLKAEFKLDDATFAAVEKLHTDFGKLCDQHCQAIMAAQDRKAPKAEIDALTAQCVTAMTAHFRQVATLMPGAQGQRYLDLVLPQISAYDHRQAATVRMN